MIVNPGPPGGAVVLLGEDGTLYQVQGLGQDAWSTDGPHYLGDDGMFTEVSGLYLGEVPGRLYLDEDGTLYEIVG
jgi:hypothetical protein